MEQLIKITSEPMRMVRFSQNARLVSSQNVDMERRKAVARQMSMRNSAGQGGISVEDIFQEEYFFSGSGRVCRPEGCCAPAPGSAPDESVCAFVRICCFGICARRCFGFRSGSARQQSGSGSGSGCLCRKRYFLHCPERRF